MRHPEDGEITAARDDASGRRRRRRHSRSRSRDRHRRRTRNSPPPHRTSLHRSPPRRTSPRRSLPRRSRTDVEHRRDRHRSSKRDADRVARRRSPELQSLKSAAPVPSPSKTKRNDDQKPVKDKPKAQTADIITSETTQDELKPQPEVVQALPSSLLQFSNDRDNVDEDSYSKRVEEQLESIIGDSEYIDVELQLRQRRERRMAILKTVQQEQDSVVCTTNGSSITQEEDGRFDAGPLTNEVAPPSEQFRDRSDSLPPIIDKSDINALLPDIESEPAPSENHISVPNQVSGNNGTVDDDVDIFGDLPIVVVKPSEAPIIPVAADNHLHLTDNWDDSEGYYSFRLGDYLHDGRYEVFANQGRGVFSTVLRVRDRMAGNRELVVKVIRNNDVMYKAGLKEVNLLKILGANDPDNHRHCVRLFSHFEHRGHLCLVFEPLHMNLREVLKKYGGVGINIDGVRSYAKQLLVALRLLVKCEIVHADIKPDNVLVNASKNVLKLCDFGSAGMISDCEITPYLVSRFYRAPEIILGLPYGPAIDIWAVGCVLFELYTGQILFKGADNNEMLLRIMELRGRFPPRLLRKATFASQHFDSEWLFERRRTDKVTGGDIKLKMRIERPVRDLQTLLRQSAGRLTDPEMKALSQLRDLIEKCLMLDPAKRISPEDRSGTP